MKTSKNDRGTQILIPTLNVPIVTAKCKCRNWIQMTNYCTYSQLFYVLHY